ncbi:50S ribosomal protein L6 [Candidatus Woesearchaeota archaeon]|nr:50S ribosomal protein L6 [Candidatus Woesearchaeota archaeon]
MKLDMTESISLPQGTAATYSGGVLIIKGPKGENKRTMNVPTVHIHAKDNQITLNSPQGTKREKALLYSALAHVKNMIRGVQEPYVYELKVCSGHFPMNVSIQGNTISVKNFLGEKVPRTATIPSGVKAAITGDKITLESTDIELAGRCASDIEHICRISNRDRRIFQDGIYIIKKCGETI